MVLDQLDEMLEIGCSEPIGPSMPCDITWIEQSNNQQDHQACVQQDTVHDDCFDLTEMTFLSLSRTANVLKVIRPPDMFASVAPKVPSFICRPKLKVTSQ